MPNSSLSAIAAGLTLLAIPAGAARATPADLAHFEIDEADPVSNLPTLEEANQEPLRFAHMLNDLSMRIDEARSRADWKQAVKYDKAWTIMGPLDAKSFAALCKDAQAAGNRDEALQACAQAIQKQGVTVADFARFVELVNSRPGGVDPIELEDARNAIEHLKGDPSSRVLANQLQCELSLTLKDDAGFRECATALQTLAPDEPTSITYGWTLALKQQDATRAAAMLDKARQNDKLKGAVPTMEKSTAEHLPDALRGSAAPMLRWLLGVALGLVALWYAARRFTRTATSA